MPPNPHNPAESGSLDHSVDLSAILGHQGGWDEALLVLGPLVVIALLLWVANRRVKTKLVDVKAGQANADASGQADSSGGHEG